MIVPPALGAFVFARRGELLAVPALALAVFGKPTPRSIAAGVPLACAGEALRAWAVGYSGATTRGSVVTAPHLVTAGPYAHVRNPLYVGNFVTAVGFALAFTGANARAARAALVLGGLGAMAAVYAIVIPHEERFLQATFGEEFAAYAAAVPRIVPRRRPAGSQRGSYDPSVIVAAESRTLVTFAAMLFALVLRGRRR